MQIGRHYSITIRGETYYTVCIGTDDKACYLKDFKGHLLAVPYTDELAFSTVGETVKYKDELDEICDREADKEFDTILQEALAAKKLIVTDTPLPARDRHMAIGQTMRHLQNLNASLQRVEGLLRAQDWAEDAPVLGR